MSAGQEVHSSPHFSGVAHIIQLLLRGRFGCVVVLLQTEGEVSMLQPPSQLHSVDQFVDLKASSLFTHTTCILSLTCATV